MALAALVVDVIIQGLAFLNARLRKNSETQTFAKHYLAGNPSSN
jgi:hypothetical protein